MGNAGDSEEEPEDLTVREGTEEELDLIKGLWLDHYRSQKLNITLPPDAFEQWLVSMKPAYGRYTINFVATARGRVVGFLAGRVRTMPSYFGGGVCGYLTEICIERAYRRHGIARKLLLASFEWYKKRGIRRVESSVMIDNHASQKMAMSVGLKPEQYLLIWTADFDEIQG
jgi:ribosomal protein S18 acetylase RimI-like enzyme